MNLSEKIGKADLHIHSNFSDGAMSIEEILEYAENQTDLDIIAITDHDTISGAKLARKIAKERNFRVSVIVGEEISAKEGHILALFLKKKIPCGLSIKETLQLIKKQSGIAIAPHPLYHTRFKSKEISIDGIGIGNIMKNLELFDAIEAFNANPMLKKQNFMIQLLNRLFLFKPEVSGSDAHIPAAIGVGYTAFEGKDIKSLKLSLIEGQTIACSNPWKFFNILRYGIFFLPKGFRVFVYTIRHGRSQKRPSVFDEIASNWFMMTTLSEKINSLPESPICD